MKKIFLTMLALAGVIGLVACSNNNDTDNYDDYEPSPGLARPMPELIDPDYENGYEYNDNDYEDINYVNPDYDTDFSFTGFENMVSVELGMSIAAAHDFLGTPTSTMTMDLLGQESTTETWMGAFSFGSLPTTTTITFTDGYATSIMETTDRSSDVTLDDYNEISIGMTESDLYDLLGMPYSVMFADILGTRMVTASWINADFTSITVTLMNGTVSSMLEMGL